jgi:hypothetical protein
MSRVAGMTVIVVFAISNIGVVVHFQPSSGFGRWHKLLIFLIGDCCLRGLLDVEVRRSFDRISIIVACS